MKYICSLFMFWYRGGENCFLITLCCYIKINLNPSYNIILFQKRACLSLSSFDLIFDDWVTMQDVGVFWYPDLFNVGKVVNCYIRNGSTIKRSFLFWEYLKLVVLKDRIVTNPCIRYAVIVVLHHYLINPQLTEGWGLWSVDLLRFKILCHKVTATLMKPEFTISAFQILLF